MITWLEGLAARDRVEAILDREAPKGRVTGLRPSEALWRAQKEVARMGFLDAEIVPTIYGWSLRYGSGLQNFGIIEGNIATWAGACFAAKRWVDEDPERRSVFTRADLTSEGEPVIGARGYWRGM